MNEVPVIGARGLNMPALGFGTFELDGKTVLRMVPEVLEMGYRHIDTAQIYDNEAEVGRAIESSGIDRRELFVTTKVWVDRYEPDDLIASAGESLARLRLDYVDLLLLHWPVFGDAGMVPALDGLMRARQDGLTRQIGVSNFNIEQLEQAVAYCGEGALATNQVEYHVYLAQTRLRRVMARHGIVLTAYMPLAKGRVVDDPVLEQIGARYGRSAAQVALRWLVEQDKVSAIPASSSPEHARANIRIFDFSLDEDDRAAIARLPKDTRICTPAGLSPAWDD